jgi:hypothetical protein
MQQYYTFDKCRLINGQHRSLDAQVNIEIDIQNSDPYGPPPPKGYYNPYGFACRGELSVEWASDGPSHLKKMLEVELVLREEDLSTKLKVVLMEFIGSDVVLPGARPGQPARIKRHMWSFICIQRPISDGLQLFPEALKRTVMKVFLFTGFLGVWNNTKTSAVIVASGKAEAIAQMKEELKQRGLADLEESDYSLVEIDPTRPCRVMVADGD